VPTEKHVLSAVVLTLPPTLSFHLVVVLVDSFIACFHQLRRGSVGSAQQTVVVRFLSFFLSIFLSFPFIGLTDHALSLSFGLSHIVSLLAFILCISLDTLHSLPG
jgi:hypothetical protein